MKSANFDELRSDVPMVLGALLVLFVGLFIGFYREGIIGVLRLFLALVWLFAIPGYALLLHWRASIGALERLVIGSLLSAASLGILSYYLGLVGLHTKTHFIVLPLLLIIMGILGWFWLSPKDEGSKV